MFMKRNAFLCAVLLLACLTGLSARSLTIKNPGDVKVYHRNGDSFESPVRPNAYGVVPDTTMIEGDAIQTKRQSLVFRLDGSTITLEPDSLMSFYRLSDKQNVLYLLRGRMRISNSSSYSGDKEYVVLTPTSRFSFTSDFAASIVSSDVSEAVRVDNGSALAFNYVTEENVVVRTGGYIDFLESLSDNITAVTAGLDGSSDFSGLMSGMDKTKRPPEFIGVRIIMEDSMGRQIDASNRASASKSSSVKEPVISSAYVSEAPSEKSSSAAQSPSSQSSKQEEQPSKSDKEDSEARATATVNVNAGQEQPKQGDVNLNIQIQQPSAAPADPDSGKTIINRYYNDYYYYYDKDGKLVMSTEIPAGMTPVDPNSALPPNFNVNINGSPAGAAPAQPVQSQSSRTSADDTRAEVLVRANVGGVVKLGNARVEIPAGALSEDTLISIEAITSMDEGSDKIQNTTGNAKGYRFLPSGKFNKDVRVTVPYDRSLNDDKAKLEKMRTYFYDEDAKGWRALQKVTVDEVNCTITSLTDHFTDMINAIIETPESEDPVQYLDAAGRQDSKLALNSLYMGAELGIESAFDGSNAADKKASPLSLSVRPYMRIVNRNKGVLFDLKLNLELDYAYVNNKYQFSFPQFDRISSKSLSVVGSISQFIEDIVVPGSLYISRNYDLPLEYNNFTLRKHNSDHNVYQSYHYETNDGPRVYDNPISFKRKLPGLLDLRFGAGFRLRAFADDLDRLMKYKGPNATQKWRRDDDAVNFAEFVMNISPVIFGVGAMYVKGGWDADDKASDKIYLTAKLGTDKLIKNFKVGFNASVPLLSYNWTKISNKPNVKFFGDIAKKFIVGFSMNTKADNITFDFGFDFSKGQLFTGLLNRHKVFDDNSLYTTGIGNLFTIYPYVNVDFDFGNFGLLVNLDFPIFFGKPDAGNAALSRLVSWKDMDFLYRLNGGVALKFKVADSMNFNIEYDMEDFLPNRGISLGGSTFKQYLANNKFTLLNLIPQFSYTLKDGPIQVKIIARHQRVKTSGAGANTINTTYTPVVSFISSVAIGNDYLFNGSYAAKRTEFVSASDRLFRIIFKVDTLFESFKYISGEADGYTAFTITPVVGIKYKSLSFIAKFDLENFNVPAVLRKGGTIGGYIDTFISELNLGDVLRIDRYNGIKSNGTETAMFKFDRRSVIYEPSYESNLRANLRLSNVLDINIADFPEFLDGLLAKNKNTYGDISLGWIDPDNTSVYLNYIAQLDWSNGFKINALNPLSLNFAVHADNLLIGLDVATTMGYENNKFAFGLQGKVENWNALADIGFGYSKKNVIDFIVRLGVQNGSLVYNQYDHLTNVHAGAFTNEFMLTKKDGTAFNKFSQFVDAVVNLHLGVGFDLNIGYNLPMSLFDSSYKGLLRDRARVKISFNYDTIDLYGLFEKRGVLCGSKGWGFNNVDDLAFALGIKFKSNYATFMLEAISSHFIYGPSEDNPALPDAANRRAFSVNVGVSFGFH